MPVVFPAPEVAVADPAQADVATGLFIKCSSAVEFESHLAENPQLLQSRVAFEARLVPQHEYFRVSGYCGACKREALFFVEFLYSSNDSDSARMPNWREHLVCQFCKLPNRQRAIVDFIEQVVAPKRLDAIYVTEQTTPFYRFLNGVIPTRTVANLCTTERRKVSPIGSA